MNVAQLKGVVEQYRQSLAAKSGKAIVFGTDGPANMGVINALVAAVEAQDRRIAELEKRITASGR